LETRNGKDEEYKLGAEPESFQLEKSGPNIYVNVPDLKQIVVISRMYLAVPNRANHDVEILVYHLLED